MAGFLVTSCGKPTQSQSPSSGSDDTALTRDTEQSAILSFFIANCPTSQITFGMESEFPTLDSWEQEWLHSGRYALVGTGPAHMNGVPQGSDTSEDVLSHTQEVTDKVSATVTVTIDKFAQLYFRQRQYTGCLRMPLAVDILDTTVGPSGKDATVTFKYSGSAPTDFANDMLARAFPATNGPNVQAQQWPMWTIEHTAFFQRLDATGWRVNSIR
jgi:hypothetical protein